MKNLVGGVESVYETERGRGERERERERTLGLKSEGERALSSALEKLGPYLFIPIVTVQDFISVSERFPPSCQFIYLCVTKWTLCSFT